MDPALLFLSGLVAAVLLWTFVTAVAHSRTFPTLFQDPRSLQALVQADLALARTPSLSEEAPLDEFRLCVTARRDIPDNSALPLLTFNFASPGASGVALIDGSVVAAFRNEQRLLIRAPVRAGGHKFVMHLDRPTKSTFAFSSDDFARCEPR